MIRTEAVQLTTVNGLAFKQKLKDGGAGITVITPDDKAVFTINKRDGSYTPYGPVNVEIFNAKAIDEAFELTKSLPFRRLGAITKVYPDIHCDEGSVDLEVEDDKAEIDVVASSEYKEFIAQYTDKNGKFSYQLMNKGLMQFAARSSIVGKKLADKEDADAIVRYIVKSKAADLARNRGMADDMLTAFIDTFDSMDTRSAFKEFKTYLRGRMSRKKR